VVSAQVQPDVIAGIEVALHELCQPLTVLRCKLELGMLKGGPEAMHEAMVDGVRECLRLNSAVETMRELVRRAMDVTEGNG
jgi:signal transduction histidine kinase